MAEEDEWSRKAGRETRGGWIWWLVAIVVAAIAIGSIVGIFVAQHRKAGGRNGGGNAAPSYPALQPLGSVERFSKPLELAMRFLDAQKSGKLPKDNPIPWRGDSALLDGKDVGLDLSKGMFDAGDNVKFGFPMAFTATILAWSILEYRSGYNASGQLQSALESLQWLTDYFVAAHPSKNELFFQVGSPSSDHVCWEKPETMDTPRPCLSVNTSKPGSDVAAETSAAMAASSLVFRSDNSSYADELLGHAKDLFSFADGFRGSYTRSFVKDQQFYNSTGYGDELLWAAAWLYHATGEEEFLEYATTGKEASPNAGWGKAPAWFSWDDKVAGLQVLLARKHIFQPQEANTKVGAALDKYKSTADELVCALLPDSPTTSTNRTRAGMIWVSQWNSIQHAVNSAFLSCLYADYLSSAGITTLSCSGKIFEVEHLRELAGFQADYILGKNPMGMSYVVGYGKKYPLRLHHRAASIPSTLSEVECKEGFQYLHTSTPNPNIAEGALVGGPFQNDSFVDDRDNSMQNEATSYNSAGLAALMASLFAAAPKLPSQLLTAQ
ncbi:hypothetical protein SELMODRAFT_417952 [Selaginella moellendorffii]|uniref:Endoglucanase n=1 Tax=Selaginella moellendorffii TaxID=88036 RepID=D8S469_SELML|nr:endoglucanase 24 [Selaginella moellendorffii]EFJ20703.1 hypothetical protein SELMODRAFT_417952 [Selaginella moellendorffii]|eukprot:XP_002978046.1 endoglucanase 24 [Selaginella moellendorffii]